MARSGEAPRVLSPLVWLLAASWLAARAIGRGFLAGLRAWDTGSAAVSRALADLGRTAARALGPAGRVLRRWLNPVSRRLGWLWRQACLRAALFLGRPLGRLGRWVLAQSVRAGKRMRRAAVRLAGWLQPVIQAVVSAAGRCSRAFRAGGRVIHRSAARLGAALRQAWAPVSRAVGRRPARRTARHGPPPPTPTAGASFATTTATAASSDSRPQSSLSPRDYHRGWIQQRHCQAKSPKSGKSPLHAVRLNDV